jgi:hypothetical protein
VAEENQLLFFGFEIGELLISKNEVERDESGSDVFRLTSMRAKAKSPF